MESVTVIKSTVYLKPINKPGKHKEHDEPNKHDKPVKYLPHQLQEQSS